MGIACNLIQRDISLPIRAGARARMGPWTDAIATAQVWAYRLGGFIVLNVLDDPAWLALMFC